MTPAIMDSTGTSLFPGFLSRDDARRATPPFETPIANPMIGTKTWADSSIPKPDANGNVMYFRLPVPGDIDPNTGKQATGPVAFYIPAQWAPLYNLPGVPNFPPYVVAPAPGFSITIAGVTSLMNPNLLSTLDQANAMQKALGYGTVSEQAVAVPNGVMPAPFQYSADEPRRVYVITPPWPNAVPLNVGSLLLQQNAHGVGMPGYWNLSNPANPTWAFTSVNAATGLLDVPTPAKPLAPGQQVGFDMFGQAFYFTPGS